MERLDLDQTPPFQSSLHHYLSEYKIGWGKGLSLEWEIIECPTNHIVLLLSFYNLSRSTQTLSSYSHETMPFPRIIRCAWQQGRPLNMVMQLKL